MACRDRDRRGAIGGRLFAPLSRPQAWAAFGAGQCPGVGLKSCRPSRRRSASYGLDIISNGAWIGAGECQPVGLARERPARSVVDFAMGRAWRNVSEAGGRKKARREPGPGIGRKRPGKAEAMSLHGFNLGGAGSTRAPERRICPLENLRRLVLYVGRVGRI
jgi:hypothetical protein